MKKCKGFLVILCLITSLSVLTIGCTPAAYDSGYPNETSNEEEISLEAVNVENYKTIGDVKEYLNDANISSKKEDGTPYKLAWCCNDMTDEQMAYITKCMQEYAKDLKIKLICFDAQSDPQKQTDQINQSIIQKCDGLIICPVDASAENIAMMKAKREGLVVVCSTMPISDEESYDVYVGPSDTMAGQQAASMIINALPDGGQVAIIEGMMGSAAQVNRDLGFTTVMKQYSNFKIVEMQTGNWTTVEAMNVMESYLAKYKDLKAVYCHNDAEALGAVQAIKNAGRNNVIVIGTDGMQTAINQIAAGSCFYGTSYVPADVISKVQILATFACLNGDKDKLEKIIYTDNVCVLQDNAPSIKSGWGEE